MSPHLRRVIAVRLAITAIALALPAAWAAGRIRAAARRARRARRPRVPGLPADGEPLGSDELLGFIAIVRGWKHTAPERTGHP